MSLASDVETLEDNYEELKSECRGLEESLIEVEGELEEATEELNELKKFKEWAELVYPEIVKDYGCVQIIEEIAHEHG